MQRASKVIFEPGLKGIAKKEEKIKSVHMVFAPVDFTESCVEEQRYLYTKQTVSMPQLNKSNAIKDCSEQK